MSLYRGPSIIGESADNTVALVLSAISSATNAANAAAAANTSEVNAQSSEEAAAASVLASATYEGLTSADSAAAKASRLAAEAAAVVATDKAAQTGEDRAAARDSAANALTSENTASDKAAEAQEWAAASAAAAASASGAQVAKRISYEHAMLRRAIDSVRYAPVTENRQYAYTSLNAAKKTNTQAAITVWEPDGTGFYGAVWTRDQSMSMEGYLDYFSADEIQAIAEYFLSKSNLVTGEVPDHIAHNGTVYWTPGMSNNWGSRAPVDGNTYLLQMFWLHFVKTGSAALYNAHKAALKSLIETGIPYNGATGCVTISDASPFVGFGFYDTVKATGDVLFPSILAYRAFLQLAEMEFELGDTAETARLQGCADTIKVGINSTLLNYYDTEFGSPNYVRKLSFYKASTIKCSGQLDMWGTMFAVWSGIPEEGAARQIANDLQGVISNSATTAVATTHQGAVRHVVKSSDYAAGQSWEAYFGAAPTFGTYQNGGFWHTATPWMCYALALIDPAAAKAQYDAMIVSMQAQDVAVRPVEWLMNTGVTLGAGKYATSAIAPLMCADLMPYSAGGASGVGVPVGGTAGQVLSKVDATDYNTVWDDPAGGAGDLMATLLNAEVSVTADVTLTASAFGKMHVCTGTAANYTVGLPAVAGNAGKIIGFRMAEALRCFVTLAGNAAEQIDGQPSRLMWRNESAILLCDGATWTKIAGKAVPMSAVMKRSAAQSVNFNTWTKIAMDATVRDNTAGSVTPCADLTNGYFAVRRLGIYQASGLVTLGGVPVGTEVNGGCGRTSASPTDNPNAFSAVATPGSGFVHVGGSGTFECTVGEYINTIAYVNIASGSYNTRDVGTVLPTLCVVEVPTW